MGVGGAKHVQIHDNERQNIAVKFYTYTKSKKAT